MDVILAHSKHRTAVTGFSVSSFMFHSFSYKELKHQEVRNLTFKYSSLYIVSIAEGSTLRGIMKCY